jgi:hypothetical protein
MVTADDIPSNLSSDSISQQCNSQDLPDMQGTFSSRRDRKIDFMLSIKSAAAYYTPPNNI